MTFTGVIPSFIHRQSPVGDSFSAGSFVTCLASPYADGAFPQVGSRVAQSEGMVQAAVGSLLYRLNALAGMELLRLQQGTGQPAAIADVATEGDTATYGFGEPSTVPCQSFSSAGLPHWLISTPGESATDWLVAVGDLTPYSAGCLLSVVGSYGRLTVSRMGPYGSTVRLTGSSSEGVPSMVAGSRLEGGV